MISFLRAVLLGIIFLGAFTVLCVLGVHYAILQLPPDRLPPPENADFVAEVRKLYGDGGKSFVLNAISWGLASLAALWFSYRFLGRGRLEAWFAGIGAFLPLAVLAKAVFSIYTADPAPSQVADPAPSQAAVAQARCEASGLPPRHCLFLVSFEEQTASNKFQMATLKPSEVSELNGDLSSDGVYLCVGESGKCEALEVLESGGNQSLSLMSIQRVSLDGTEALVVERESYELSGDDWCRSIEASAPERWSNMRVFRYQEGVPLLDQARGWRTAEPLDRRQIDGLDELNDFVALALATHSSEEQLTECIEIFKKKYQGPEDLIWIGSRIHEPSGSYVGRVMPQSAQVLSAGEAQGMTELSGVEPLFGTSPEEQSLLKEIRGDADLSLAFAKSLFLTND